MKSAYKRGAPSLGSPLEHRLPSTEDMSRLVPAPPGGTPPFKASQVHLRHTHRLPGTVPFVCLCPFGNPPGPSPSPCSCHRSLHTHRLQPEHRFGTLNARHLFWRLTDSDKYNHSLCWSFSLPASQLCYYFWYFFSPTHIYPIASQGSSTGSCNTLCFGKTVAFSLSPSRWPMALNAIPCCAKALHRDAAPRQTHGTRMLQQLCPPHVHWGHHTRRGYLWGSILTFCLYGLWGPWPRGVTSCPGHGCTMQNCDWSWGHWQGRRGRLTYPCLKVPTTRKFLLISVQGAFFCQWVCFDRGLLPRQPRLISCAGRRTGKRTLKCECSNISISPPTPILHSLPLFSSIASVGT